jgi:hypothetical protein
VIVSACGPQGKSLSDIDHTKRGSLSSGDERPPSAREGSVMKDVIQQAKVDLAAALRLAARFGLNEGV